MKPQVWASSRCSALTWWPAAALLWLAVFPSFAADAPVPRLQFREFLYFPSPAGPLPPDATASDAVPSKGTVAVAPTSREEARWLRARFVLRTVPRDAAALYISSALLGLRVFINGAELGNTSVSNAESFGWNYPLYYSVPAALLRPGDNTIDLRLKLNPAGRGGLRGMELGSHAELKPLYDRVLFWRVTGPQITSLITVLLGIGALLVWLRRRRETVYGWFGAACLLAALRNGHFYVNAPLPTRWYEIWASVPLHWMSVALVLFSLRLCGRSFARAERGLIAIAAAWSLAIVLIERNTRLVDLGYLWLMLLSVATIVLVTIWCWRQPQLDRFMLLIALWVAQVFGMLDLSLLLGLRQSDARIYFVPYSMLFFSLVMGANLVDAFAKARTQQERINEELDARLAEREREIAIEHGRVLQLQRERVAAEERERIVRDIHDGLGSQLISSILLVEAGTLAGPAVATVLRECVDDLRLAIDSLKPAGNELLLVLGNFRYRMEPRLAQASVRLDWQIAANDMSPSLSSDQVLHTLRIVQEAFTNALKHARPRCMTVHYESRCMAGWTLAVSDDGEGFNLAAQEGRGDGLRNMRARAMQIPAALEICSGPGGTTVRIAVR
jgi:signal transduction histidine kinase